MQVRGFLERYPPFDALADEELDRVVEGVEIAFFPAGETILREAGEPARALYVVRTGAVELLDDGVVLDLLGEGESFGHGSLLSGMSPAYEVRAAEDTLCYLVDPAVAQEVLGTRPGLSFLAASLRRRATRAAEAREATRPGPRVTMIGDLVRRSPVMAERSMSVRDAAALMARERVSSVLVPGGEGLGIVTDRDLRARVLAEGRGAVLPLRVIVSSPVVSAPADTTVEETILLMLERGIHHVPVTGSRGELIGVVTDTDLMGLARTDAFACRRAIERAADPGAVSAELRRLPEVAAGLVRSDVDPVQIGRVVAIAIDAATTRLIQLAIEELGEPPCAWAWLAFGSQARQEQALLTDQDHGLAFDPGGVDPEPADRFFQALAGRVADGLETGGIERCRGGVMAEHPPWRRTVEGWVGEFRRWMGEPAVEGKVFTSIALDYRRVAGPIGVERRLDEVIREAPRRVGFVRRLGRAAIELRPPTGFVRDLVVEGRGRHAGTLDVKAGGIVPITNLARAHAAAAGLATTGTLARLRAAASAGGLDAALASELEEAFRLLWRVRLEHQAEQVAGGLAPDNRVDPAALGTIVRGGLKDAFRTIARAQRELALELGLSPA
jgi:CBS domain-containing protein